MHIHQIWMILLCTNHIFSHLLARSIHNTVPTCRVAPRNFSSGYDYISLLMQLCYKCVILRTLMCIHHTFYLRSLILTRFLKYYAVTGGKHGSITDSHQGSLRGRTHASTFWTIGLRLEIPPEERVSKLPNHRGPRITASPRRPIRWKVSRGDLSQRPQPWRARVVKRSIFDDARDQKSGICTKPP